MARINLYLSENAKALLKQLATEKDMSTSQYMNQLINKAAKEKEASTVKISEQISKLSATQQKNSRNITALLLLMNNLISQSENGYKKV